MPRTHLMPVARMTDAELVALLRDADDPRYDDALDEEDRRLEHAQFEIDMGLRDDSPSLPDTWWAAR